MRPSTGEGSQVRRLLQCVGSRDETVGNAYCSRVCCMRPQERPADQGEVPRDGGLDPLHRPSGQGEGYEEFYVRAQRLGISFIRGRVSRWRRWTGAFSVNYGDTLLGASVRGPTTSPSSSRQELEPNKDADVVGNLLGLAKRPDGFFEIAHPKMRPVEAHIDGVFIAGCASGPKEIQVSIARGRRRRRRR